MFKQGVGLKRGADSKTNTILSIRLDEFGFNATYIGKGFFGFCERDVKCKLAFFQHLLVKYC